MARTSAAKKGKATKTAKARKTSEEPPTASQRSTRSTRRSVSAESADPAPAPPPPSSQSTRPVRTRNTRSTSKEPASKDAKNDLFNIPDPPDVTRRRSRRANSRASSVAPTVSEVDPEEEREVIDEQGQASEQEDEPEPEPESADEQKSELEQDNEPELQHEATMTEHSTITNIQDESYYTTTYTTEYTASTVAYPNISHQSVEAGAASGGLAMSAEALSDYNPHELSMVPEEPTLEEQYDERHYNEGQYDPYRGKLFSAPKTQLISGEREATAETSDSGDSEATEVPDHPQDLDESVEDNEDSYLNGNEEDVAEEDDYSRYADPEDEGMVYDRPSSRLAHYAGPNDLDEESNDDEECSEDGTEGSGDEEKSSDEVEDYDRGSRANFKDSSPTEALDEYSDSDDHVDQVRRSIRVRPSMQFRPSPQIRQSTSEAIDLTADSDEDDMEIVDSKSAPSARAAPSANPLGTSSGPGTYAAPPIDNARAQSYPGGVERDVDSEPAPLHDHFAQTAQEPPTSSPVDDSQMEYSQTENSESYLAHIKDLLRPASPISQLDFSAGQLRSTPKGPPLPSFIEQPVLSPFEPTFISTPHTVYQNDSDYEIGGTAIPSLSQSIAPFGPLNTSEMVTTALQIPSQPYSVPGPLNEAGLYRSLFRTPSQSQFQSKSGQQSKVGKTSPFPSTNSHANINNEEPGGKITLRQTPDRDELDTNFNNAQVAKVGKASRTSLSSNATLFAEALASAENTQNDTPSPPIQHRPHTKAYNHERRVMKWKQKTWNLEQQVADLKRMIQTMESKQKNHLNKIADLEAQNADLMLERDGPKPESPKRNHMDFFRPNAAQQKYQLDIIRARQDQKLADRNLAARAALLEDETIQGSQVSSSIAARRRSYSRLLIENQNLDDQDSTMTETENTNANTETLEPSVTSPHTETPSPASATPAGWFGSVKKVLSFGWVSRSQNNSPSKPTKSPSKLRESSTSSRASLSKSTSRVPNSNSHRTITPLGPRFDFNSGSSSQAAPPLGALSMSVGSQPLRSVFNSSRSAMASKRQELQNITRSARRANITSFRYEPESPLAASQKRKASGRTFGYDEEDLINSDDEINAEKEVRGTLGKKRRLQGKETTSEQGFWSHLPLQGQPGYHSSIQLPSPDTRGGDQESDFFRTPALSRPDSSSPHVFGDSSVPGAILGTSIADQGEIDHDVEDTTVALQSNNVGRTYGLFYSDDSDTDETDTSLVEAQAEVDSSIVEEQVWKGKKFSQWTKTTATAFLAAPLPPEDAIDSDVLRDAVDTIVNKGETPYLPNYPEQEAYPELVRIGITPDQYLLYPRPSGDVTRMSRKTYYSEKTIMPGTHHMSPGDRAAWKVHQEHLSRRKYRSALKAWMEDDTLPVIAELDRRHTTLSRKRKLVEDLDHELAEKEEEHERRRKLLEQNEKDLDERRKALQVADKGISEQSRSPTKRPNVALFGSSSTNAADDEADAFKAARDAAARVKAPATPLPTTASTDSNPSAWTQPPPPAPSPAHAQLPQAKAPSFAASAAAQTQLNVDEALEREKQKANRYAPKKSSGLSHMSRFSTPTATPVASQDGGDDVIIHEEPRGTIWDYSRFATPEPFDVAVPCELYPRMTDRIEAAIEAGLKHHMPLWEAGVGTILMPEMGPMIPGM
jgi:hypothetical protein